MESFEDKTGLRKTSNRFSMANLPSLYTKSSKSSKSSESIHAQPLKSPLNFSTQESARYDSKASSLKSNNSNGYRPNKITRKPPGSRFGSIGSVGKLSLSSIGGDSTTSSDGLIEPSLEAQEPYVYRNRTRTGKQSVKQHGEVQTNMGIFRKKKEYLVLTETHLLRFKNEAQAAEAFPEIYEHPKEIKTNHMKDMEMSKRHASTASVSSIHSSNELKSLNSRSSTDGQFKSSIPLHQVVATHKVEDGRPSFITEVVYFDDDSRTAGSIEVFSGDPDEADCWHTSIRAQCQKVRLMTGQMLPERIINYAANILDAALDYNPSSMQIFRAVRKPLDKAGNPLKAGKKSTEDLKNLGSAVCYLVFGINKLHILSPSPVEGAKSSTFKASKASHGYMTLTGMEIDEADDAIDIIWRLPLQPEVRISLATSQAHDIAHSLYRSVVYLRPNWLDNTFGYYGPPSVIDDSDVDFGLLLPEDHHYFDRTLLAYCSAYGCVAANIRYMVDYYCEDGPEFVLLPPDKTKNYSLHELLAIFRSLRWQKSFNSISFAGISLQALYGVVDKPAENPNEHVAWRTRQGVKLLTLGINPHDKSLLWQEVQGLAMMTSCLRRLNFSNCMPERRVKTPSDDEFAPRDPGCEIVAGFFALCVLQLTDVDWIILNGVELSEMDMEAMTPAIQSRLSHFRAVEVAKCGLNDQLLQAFLRNLGKQAGTLECINIADNPGRLDLSSFPVTMSRFQCIRKLELARATSTTSEVALLQEEVLLTWRLEELILTGLPINEKTLDAICAYLHSDMSRSLRILQLDQCNLTGSHVAIIMRSMCENPGEGRDLKLCISANRLERGNRDISRAIKEDFAPSHLIMRMVEYDSESRFRELLEAVSQNTTIKILDISKASLPTDASEETCLTLQRIFEENTTLEELDVSGEQAHLETARFGRGFYHSLSGLKTNRTLRTLKIEHQGLGVEGADALATVILENETLTHIYCEHNGINLQGFTVIVNSLAKNFSILHIPFLLKDQAESVKQMKGKMNESGRNVAKAESNTKHAVRKTAGLLGVHMKQERPSATPQDIDRAIDVLNQRWEKQKTRMSELLLRNYNIAQGLESRCDYEDNGNKWDQNLMRPHTAGSDSFIMETVMKNTTPRYERSNPLSQMDGNENLYGSITPMQSDSNYRRPVPENNGSPMTIRREKEPSSSGVFLPPSPPRRQRGLSELTARFATFELGADGSLHDEDGDGDATLRPM